MQTANRQAPLRRIVLTGGPGSGKTVVSAAIAARDPARFALVMEAATDVYARRQTRWDRATLDEKRDIQREIYRLQTEREQAATVNAGGRVVLLDRGTIDGAAYWPGGPADYWRELGTTHTRELDRYDVVVWLQTAAAIGRYTGDADNSIRFEAAPEAVLAGDKLLEPALWGGHRRLLQVPATADVEAKIRAVAALLDDLLRGSPAQSEQTGYTSGSH